MAKATCPHCSKTCKSHKGLQQHIRNNKQCQSGQNALAFVEAQQKLASPKRKSSEAFSDLLEKDNAARQKLVRAFSPNKKNQTQEGAKQQNPHHTGLEPYIQHPMGVDGDFDPYATASEQSSNQDMFLDDDSEQEDEHEVEVEGIPVQASKESRSQFKAYVRNAYQNFAQLEEKEWRAAQLLRTLLKKKASMDTYEAVLEWHLVAAGKMREGTSLGNCQHYISRKKLMDKLRKRYNMDKKYAQPKEIVLPFSKTKVVVWYKHARDIVQSILTDPRWKDEDFLYFEDNPFAPPPEDLDYIGDVNTGKAYIETYKKLITKPNQILVGIPLYIDGAVTGQFDKLQVEALKMTLCILNRKARDKECAWRSLGYITNYAKEDSRGQKIFVDSGHVAAHELYVDISDEEGEVEGQESEVDKAADYHAMLSVLMESLRELIKEGMVVDIRYKGKLYKDCELVFFVPFVKCDGDEGDKLCSRYRSRTKNVKQLCRYCKCPNEQTDNPQANFKYKEWTEIKKLRDRDDVEALQNISQVNIDNAFHGLRFGLQNNRGIHGACPWELLHAILLGIFKYARDCFIAQVGPDSAAAAEINSLSKLIGSLFTRQSDRDKPRTNFAKGIQKGKLMAKEYTGVLLVMAAILRCKSGQDILKKARKKNFREDWLIKDWTLLVETLLQWEAHLCLAEMDKKHVTRLEKKNRFIMFLLKKVGHRTKGMGFKVMKFHAIIHLVEDIIMFGVPMNVDTGSNESHHKTTKVAAKLTQKDIKTFEKQTSDRCDDFEVLDLAEQERQGRPLWEYYDGYIHKDFVEKEEEDTIGGMMYHVFRDQETNLVRFDIKTRMAQKDDVAIDLQLLHYLEKLQNKLQTNVATFDKLQICAEHTRSGQMFRAHPNYRGKGPWRDWVMLQWQEGDFPAQIWCFLDLTGLPTGIAVEVDENSTVNKGIYAVVSSTVYVEEDSPLSDIFTPLKLESEMVGEEGQVLKRRFYLVDVEAFKDPLCVIPNVGTKDEYLMMKPRAQWSDDFITWLEMPHKCDKMEMLPDVEEGEEEEEEEDNA